jgi:hypothetical protein
MENPRKHPVGRCYIAGKEVFRMVVGLKDYTALCLHKHATEEEALSCEEAWAKLPKTPDDNDE